MNLIFFQSNRVNWSAIPTLFNAGLAWNHGEFDKFFRLVRSSLIDNQRRQGNSWWWMTYEEAYLAVVRLKQNNTTEAMLHSFRAIEGLLTKWAVEFFEEVTTESNKYPVISKRIIKKYPQLERYFNAQGEEEINLQGWVLQSILEAAIPEAKSSKDFKIFWSNVRRQRNNLAHQIGGLSRRNVWRAWGNDVNNQLQWENRLLNCLNLVTENKFNSLMQASLFASTHHRVKEQIANIN